MSGGSLTDRPDEGETELQFLLEGNIMKLFKLANTFKQDESGAVTVDWVVLTAAIVGLGVAVLATVRGGMETIADNISDGLSDTEIGSDSF